MNSRCILKSSLTTGFKFDAPQRFLPSVPKKGVVGSSATRVEDLRLLRKFGDHQPSSRKTNQPANSISATTRQRHRSKHAPRSRQQRSKHDHLTYSEPTQQLRLQSLVQFPPLPVSEDTEVPKAAATPAPYGYVLALALPAPPLTATFSSVAARKVRRRLQVLVPHRLIARFAANSNERRPSLRRLQRVPLRRQATRSTRSTKLIPKVFLPAQRARRELFARR